MRVQEYQAKSFFKRYSIPVLDSHTVGTPDKAEKAARRLGGKTWAVKAQILAGGRGKSGGVKIVHSPEEVRSAAAELLGKNLVTPQTGPEGEKVEKILIEKGCEIEKEYYVSLLADPEVSRPVFMVSEAGGMDIEKTALETPEKIYKESVHPFFGFLSCQAWSLGRALGFTKKEDTAKLIPIFQGLYKLFVEKDVSLLEINPLIKSKGGDLIALDGKMSFDDNALYRHPDLELLAQQELKEEHEILAKKHGLSLIKLEGNIGCMVNGAGLAMATMDMIKLHGGAPANFLDVGGGAETEKVATAFKIILKFPNVKAVLINIFGGIMKCDIIAEGLIRAVRKVGLTVPVVVRLEGTRSREGLELLKASGLNLIPSDNLNSAGKKVVEAVRGDFS